MKLLPPPEDFAEKNAVMMTDRLAAYYRVSRRVISKWRKETATYAKGKSGRRRTEDRLFVQDGIGFATDPKDMIDTCLSCPLARCVDSSRCPLRASGRLKKGKR